MHQLLTPPQEIRTDRLLLVPVTPADLDDLTRLLGDRSSAEHAVQDAIGSRIRHGLGSWVAYRVDGGAFVGFGGAVMDDSGEWVVEWWTTSAGRADVFGAEVERAAVDHVHRIDPGAVVRVRPRR